jgi:predicted metal-dependent hydrolase
LLQGLSGLATGTPTAQISLPFEIDPNLSPTCAGGGAQSAHPALEWSALVFTRHPRARRYILRVDDGGTVRVTIPRGGSKKEARAFADQERAWIQKQLRRHARDGHEGREAQEGQEAIEGRRARELVERSRAQRELPARLLELAARHGLSIARISVRNQKWRWGSCSRSGRICLNWRLVQLPCDVRDYVLIHELMHLKRMDHSPRFWRLVEQACPDYRTLRRRLRVFNHPG